MYVPTPNYNSERYIFSVMSNIRKQHVYLYINMKVIKTKRTY